jgi:hypothetical protein
MPIMATTLWLTHNKCISLTEPNKTSYIAAASNVDAVPRVIGMPKMWHATLA